ncbi:MAG: Fructose-bisphosphate aldolase class 1 [Holosporales bacterium]
MMHFLSDKVRRIINFYEGESIALKTNLLRLLNHGALKNSGKMMILAVDQGFEHGPDKMFGMNQKAYDPHYIYHLAANNGLSGLAAPLGLLQAGALSYLGQVPLILKINSNNILMKRDPSAPDQAITATVQDAVDLGCCGIGFTIYPGSDQFLEQLEELRTLSAQAKRHGLVVIVWAYVRGHMPKEEEQALDLITYGAHMACLMGAHIVKVKIPKEQIYMPDAAKQIAAQKMPIQSVADRVAHVVRGCFSGRRIVIFSGNDFKQADDLIHEAQGIVDGGGFGSIIGRNFFQRPEEEAKDLIQHMQNIYL